MSFRLPVSDVLHRSRGRRRLVCIACGFHDEMLPTVQVAMYIP